MTNSPETLLIGVIALPFVGSCLAVAADKGAEPVHRLMRLLWLSRMSACGLTSLLFSRVFTVTNS
jgi:hypothetical protein